MALTKGGGGGRHVRNAGEAEARVICSPVARLVHLIRPVRLIRPAISTRPSTAVSAHNVNLRTHSSKDSRVAQRRHDERIQRKPRVIAPHRNDRQCQVRRVLIVPRIPRIRMQQGIAHERRRGCPSRDGALDGVPPRAKDVVVCFPHGFPVGAPELQRARQPREPWGRSRWRWR